MGFRHCKDYVAYVWAKHEDVDRNIYQVLKGKRGRGKRPITLGGSGFNLEGSVAASLTPT